MGQTRRYAERISLVEMTPSETVASTGYCLVNPGKEYLVYLPAGGTVTVDLSATQDELTVEWFDPIKDRTVAGGTVRGGDRHEFRAPFQGMSVLYLAIGRCQTP